jgi:hypothetical protein
LQLLRVSIIGCVSAIRRRPTDKNVSEFVSP